MIKSMALNQGYSTIVILISLDVINLTIIIIIYLCYILIRYIRTPISVSVNLTLCCGGYSLKINNFIL